MSLARERFTRHMTNSLPFVLPRHKVKYKKAAKSKMSTKPTAANKIKHKIN